MGTTGLYWFGIEDSKGTLKLEELTVLSVLTLNVEHPMSHTISVTLQRASFCYGHPSSAIDGAYPVSSVWCDRVRITDHNT